MKFIFLDRDGVINKDPGGWTEHDYVTRAGDFHFLPGALEALRLLNENGMQVLVVSNQAGVGRGLFSRKDLDSVNSHMLSEAVKNGGKIEAVYYCIHTKEDNCGCRKPRTGLFERAMKRFVISARDTYFVGDSRTDIAAGRAAGLKTILVLCGKTPVEEAKRLKERPEYVFPDLLGAVKWLIEKERRRSFRAISRKKEKRRDG